MTNPPADLRAQMAAQMPRGDQANKIDALTQRPVGNPVPRRVRPVVGPPPELEEELPPEPVVAPPPPRIAAPERRPKPRKSTGKRTASFDLTPDAIDAKRFLAHWALDAEAPIGNVVSELLVTFRDQPALRDHIAVRLQLNEDGRTS